MISLVQCVSPYFAVFLVQIYMQEILELQGGEAPLHATFSSYLVPTLLETLISKYDFGPVKLPGLSRNGPQAP